MPVPSDYVLPFPARRSVFRYAVVNHTLSNQKIIANIQLNLNFLTTPRKPANTLPR